MGRRLNLLHVVGPNTDPWYTPSATVDLTLIGLSDYQSNTLAMSGGAMILIQKIWITTI